ncbi:uncharacterized protein LOC106423573 [Brassica napus]|uniref:uncharacterized protein LOC106330026 n=1 Tax=Brassica oleracea var. oleracea TaxID=109376 RepID=UPI0006A6D263|nr:PREDICTED: uncharacterized protein LOC106330026 [Brassica oleracea var. oleracea]XP_022554989.1 uncharacterized protein LOC106423573 [Brassica napus]XP_022554990.1 uncharacterized protein LOC106423573 [Brassica napus]
MSLSVSQICSAYILIYLLVLSLPEPKCHNRVSKPKYNSLQNLRTDGVPFHKSCFRCSHCKSTLQEMGDDKMAHSKLQDNLKKLQGISLKTTEMEDTAKPFYCKGTVECCEFKKQSSKS